MKKNFFKRCATSSSRIICLITIILFEAYIPAQAETSVFDTIMSRIRNANFPKVTPKTEKNVDSCLAILNEDGSFKDIDYNNTHRTLWSPQLHLQRINGMVNCYIKPDNRFYKSEQLYNSIVKTLEFWIGKNPKSSNWWHNQIAAPQSLGIILIGMRAGNQTLPATLETSILRRLIENGGNPLKQTGANKLDVATHYLYRSCLEKNPEGLAFAADQSFYPLFLTNDEGIQQDWSYFQHGQQLYIGGYGKVLIDGMVDIAKYLVGTKYALSGEKLNILSTFVRETYLKSIRGQYHLFNVLGRSMSRKGTISQTGLAKTLETLKKIDNSHATEYDEAIKRLKGTEASNFGLKALNKHYWRADYTVHQRPGFTFDVRLVSTRTARNENGNEENLKGYFLADGGTDIADDGDEYASIMPVWDWSRIPGTTAPALASIPLPPAWSEIGKSTFAGGVSDGLYGASGYSMTDIDYGVNTLAKKSWFFFDKEVVCLGAGIRSTSSEPIRTSVNQCLLKGEVSVSTAESAKAQKNGIITYPGLKWVWHNNIAYLFPQGTDITVSNQTQRGSWYEINKTQSTEIISKDVFSVWFNHGIKPQNGSYAYIVVPNIDNPENISDNLLSNIEILANIDSMQVVRHKKLDIYSLIFYKGGTYSKEGFSITTNKSCALMIKNSQKPKVKVVVANPAQDNAAIQLKVKFPGIKKEKLLNCEVLRFPFNGSSREYIVKK